MYACCKFMQMKEYTAERPKSAPLDSKGQPIGQIISIRTLKSL